MNTLPIIAVVGSPNAGKSTLVNRLTGTRATVVHETPGVTRDRKEIEVEWTGHRLLLVDTGGYDTTEDAPFAGHIRDQVEHAIAAADVVLFVLDGRAGPLTDDYAIADVLRRAKAPVVVVANKMDDPASTATAPEIYALGLGEPLLFSAVHGTGSGELLDRLIEVSGAVLEDAEAEVAPAETPVAIVGRPNAGKSSLFNAIAGETRTIVSELAGTTRDAIDSVIETDSGRFRFIDTAGMRKAAKVSGVEYYSYLRSVQSLDRAHVAIIVVDATMRFGELDLSICTEATHRNCATIIAVNKCDIAEPDLEEIAGIAQRKLRQRPPVIAVSAETRRGVKEVLRKVAELDALYTSHISTRALNRALAELAADRPDAAEARQAAQDVLHRPVRHLAAAHRHRDQRPHAGDARLRLLRREPAAGAVRPRRRAARHRLQGQALIVVKVVGFIVLFVLAYLAGSIPFGVVVGKVFYGVDVREHGSGNVGTTNVFRVLGKKAGAVVMVCDILKGYIPAAIAAALFTPWAAIFIAAAPVVGHIYSIFLKGRGGKGIATGSRRGAGARPAGLHHHLRHLDRAHPADEVRQPGFAGGRGPGPRAHHRLRRTAPVPDRRRARGDPRVVGASRQHPAAARRRGKPRQAALGAGAPVGRRDGRRRLR